MDQETINELSPEIKELVVWLNERGFETTDSGDGSNHAEGMECASEQPMVAIQVDHPLILIQEADRLYQELKAKGVDLIPPESDCDCVGITWPAVHASYDPVDGMAILVLLNVTSKDVGL